MLQSFLRKRSPGSGQKIIVVGNDLIIEVVVTHTLVLQHDPSQVGRNGDVPFFIALAVDQDDIIPDVFTLDVADLRVSCACVESDRQHHLISCGQEGGVIKGGQQGPHLIIIESLDQDLGFFLSLNFQCRIGADVFLLDGETEESPQAFENTVDVCCRQLLIEKVLNVVLDMYRADFIYLSYLMVLLCVCEKIQGVIIVTLDGSVGEPPKLAIQFELI